MNANALELDSIIKRYGDFTAVDTVSFRLPPGAIYGFLGPNGAGKTTTIRMILDIIRPTSGRLSILGHPSALAIRNRIGYLPEEKGLYKKMKAWSIIAYFATLKGMSSRSAKKRAHELLEKYGLGDFTNARTEALSKGMGQKVQILASIAHDPELIILDEPFSGLDPVNQQVMEEIIRDMANRGATVLFSTHVMQHAERLCNRILLLSKGRLIFDGTIHQARRLVPRRVQLETDQDISSLSGLDGVANIAPADDPSDANGQGQTCPRWEVHIQENGDPQQILQACFARGIRLKSFNQADPSLHEVFMHLVGPEARKAGYR